MKSLLAGLILRPGMTTTNASESHSEWTTAMMTTLTAPS